MEAFPSVRWIDWCRAHCVHGEPSVQLNQPPNHDQLHAFTAWKKRMDAAQKHVTYCIAARRAANFDTSGAANAASDSAVLQAERVYTEAGPDAALEVADREVKRCEHEKEWAYAAIQECREMSVGSVTGAVQAFHKAQPALKAAHKRYSILADRAESHRKLCDYHAHAGAK
jgi:hypothetical protein